MLFYITELSKYCITFLMILYCVECTIYLLKRNENKNYGIFLRQGIYMFAIQFLAYLTLCLRTGKIDYLFFYAILQILIFAMIILYHMIYPRVESFGVISKKILTSKGPLCIMLDGHFWKVPMKSSESRRKLGL